jgi:hypothetical protein
MTASKDVVTTFRNAALIVKITFQISMGKTTYQHPVPRQFTVQITLSG